MRTTRYLDAVVLALAIGTPVGCSKPQETADAGAPREPAETASVSAGVSTPRVAPDPSALLPTEASAPPAISDGQTARRKATLATFLAQPKAKLTLALEEALLLDFDGRDPRATAPSVQPADTQWSAAHRHPKAAGMADDAARLQALATKHLRDPSPAVRAECVELWDSWTAGDDGRATLLAAAQAETSPDVLRRMLPRMKKDLAGSAEVQALYLRSADSPSADLRKAAVLGLLEAEAAGVPGAFEKVADRLANDPSEDVRYNACLRLYGTRDERALPLFERYLNDPATPDAVYRGCWAGVELAWLPVFAAEQHPSAQAFRLTMTGLEKTPRTGQRPPAALDFLAAAAQTAPAGGHYQEWRAAAAGFLDLPRLVKALESIVVDPAAGAETRGEAVTDLRALGESDAALATLRQAIVQMDRQDAGAAGDGDLVKALSASGKP